MEFSNYCNIIQLYKITLILAEYKVLISRKGSESKETLEIKI